MTFLVAETTFAFAQQKAANSESIIIHTNSTIFITGETLYCKLYCLNPNNKTASQISKIVYAELIDSDRKSVSKHKLYLENGMAQGDFFIPTTFKTGNYKLIAYTQWMLNISASNFFEMDLSIINPFQPLANNSKTAEQVPEIANPGSLNTNSQSNILLEIGSKRYSSREKVNLKIKDLTRNNGHYSVSVRKTDAFPVKTMAQMHHIAKPAIESKIDILPELRGEMISGNITSRSGSKDLGKKAVTLSIPGKSFAFKVTYTDSSGKFTFILDKDPIASTAFIQVLEDNRNDYSLTIDEPRTTDLSSLTFAAELLVTPDFKTVIEEKSVANQIENAYYETKKDSIEKASIPDAFYHPLEKRYVLDDYTRFPSLRETITEVVMEMYTKKSDGKSSIHLRNPLIETENFGKPLILVDGLLIQDTNELYDYNPENIYAIDVLNQPYVYGPKTFSGIANIITKNTDYETKASGDFIKKIEIARPASHKSYFKPAYEPGNTLKRIPDYRHQLLWLPEIAVDGNENILTFYTSDIPGKYEIVIEGFTNDGQPVFVKDSFEVQ